MITARVRPALVAWLLILLVLIASGLVLLPFPRRPTEWEEVVWSVGFGVGFATVGALLVDRRPREPVSWITLGIGLIVVASLGLRAIAVWLDARPGDTPAVAALAAVISESLQTLAFLVSGTFLLVRFPHGREPGRLSDAADALLVALVIALAAEAFAPGPLDVYWLPAMDNPIGLAFLGTATRGDAGALMLGVYVASLAIAIVSLAKRYRRSDPATRAQIRWVAAAASVTVVVLPLLIVTEWAWSAWIVSTVLLPIAIGIAILRYRLFEIDRIVSRTLAYAVVTGLLAGVFVVTNLALQAVVATVAGADTLAVAGSTLIVASLFQPIRRRIQAPIDRRFNRAHLDRTHVVARFAREARDEVDLDRLRGRVVDAADQALAPMLSGMWLRRPR